jgi:hypothetical protein
VNYAPQQAIGIPVALKTEESLDLSRLAVVKETPTLYQWKTKAGGSLIPGIYNRGWQNNILKRTH